MGWGVFAVRSMASDEDGAADAVVPCLAEIVAGAVHVGERRVWNDGIARGETEGGGFGGGVRTDIKHEAVAGEDLGSVLGGDDVDVADAGDSVDRALAAGG